MTSNPALSVLDTIDRQLLPGERHGASRRSDALHDAPAADEPVTSAIPLTGQASSYSAAQFTSVDEALQPIERALREQATLLVLDNMESLLVRSWMQADEALADEALGLCQRLVGEGDTQLLLPPANRCPRRSTTTPAGWTSPAGTRTTPCSSSNASWTVSRRRSRHLSPSPREGREERAARAGTNAQTLPGA